MGQKLRNFCVWLAALLFASALFASGMEGQCASEANASTRGDVVNCQHANSTALETSGSEDGTTRAAPYEPKEKKVRLPKPDFNREIYYRNKLEFALDGGWLPVNIPFPFNVFEGDPYDLYPLRYTLVPVIASLRWHMGNSWGWPVIRGNWDMTFSASYTAITKGAETRYFSYDMGLRRNFIPRNWRATPYWDVRAGLGLINAKGPMGVYYAQGQNFTFNINMGAGVRYNLNPHYSFSAGLNWMHISNANLSAPAYSNYGINVYGPMFGVDIRLGRHGRSPDRQELGAE
jgi:Lipid A 3-O-deacylase (PagL)